MPKHPPVPTNPTDLISADIATLTARRAGLETRRAEAAAVLLTAKGERRRLLVEHDNPPAADLAKADRACRDAQDTHDAAADALTEIDSRIADARDRLDRLTMAETRDREAKVIEASAAAAAAALDRIRAAAAEIGAATADLASAILPTAAACYTPTAINDDAVAALTTTHFGYKGEVSVWPIAPGDIALRLAGHVLAAVLPGYAVTTIDEARTLRGNGFPTPVLAPAADRSTLDAVLVGPMRAHAEDVRSGSVKQVRPERRQPPAFRVGNDGQPYDLDGVALDPGGYYPEGAAA